MNPLLLDALPDYGNSPEYLATPNTTLPIAVQDGFIGVLIAVAIAAVGFALYARHHHFGVEEAPVAHVAKDFVRAARRCHRKLRHLRTGRRARLETPVAP